MKIYNTNIQKILTNNYEISSKKFNTNIENYLHSKMTFKSLSKLYKVF